MKNEPPFNIPTDFKPDNRPDFIKKLDAKMSEHIASDKVSNTENPAPSSHKPQFNFVDKPSVTPSFNPSFKLHKPEDKKKKEADAKRVSYIKKVMSFYFAPLLRSFLTILYLFFFLYFVIFYFENIIIGVRFLIYTIAENTIALSLDHLFWGAIFVILIIVPFSVSLYSIFIPFEVRKMTHWHKAKKIVVILFAAIATIDAIIVSDFLLKFVEDQRPIRKFLYDKDIVIRKNY